MAQETYDRAAEPGGSGVEYEYGGGTAGAEEAAVHLTDEDEDEIAGRPEG